MQPLYPNNPSQAQTPQGWAAPTMPAGPSPLYSATQHQTQTFASNLGPGYAPYSHQPQHSPYGAMESTSYPYPTPVVDPYLAAPGAYAPPGAYADPAAMMAPPPAASPPPPALNATDENGLRWTWSAYPSAAALFAALHPDPSGPTAALPASGGPMPTSTTSAAAAALLNSATGVLSKVGKSSAKRKNSYFPAPPDMIIPLSCMHQPLMPLADPTAATVYESTVGLQCNNCGSFCSVHSIREEGRSWICLCCQRMFPMPSGVNPTHPVFRLETVEYVVSPALPVPSVGYNPNAAPASTTVGAPIGPPCTNPGVRDPLALVFLLDTCVTIEELKALTLNLLDLLKWVPPKTLVGFITIGSTTCIWELGNKCFFRCYSVRGTKELNFRGFQKALQLHSGQSTRGRFLVPLEECRERLVNAIQNLVVDNQPVPSPERPTRTTGTAVSAATFLLEALLPNNASDISKRSKGSQEDYTTPTTAPLPSHLVAAELVPGRILLFVGGPCTRGGGAVVSKKKEDMMRFHRDILSGNVPFCEAATKFYTTLAGRLCYTNACLDVFAQSYDQIGVMEMRACVNGTGGTMICGDAFEHQNFSNSLRRYMLRTGVCSMESMATSFRAEEPLEATDEIEEWMVANAGTSGVGVEVEVFTTHGDLVVVGALGPCVPAAASGIAPAAERAKSQTVGQSQVGLANGSNRWFASSMQQDTSIAFVFDVSSSAAGTLNSPSTAQRFVQFVTRYRSLSGEQRVRVTSVLLPIAPLNVPSKYFTENGTFDQTCAATVVARIAAHAMEKNPGQWELIRRALDDLLISFVARFATYTMGNEESVRLDPSVSLFPIFLFNLRRSEYFTVLNISPDETTFKRHWLLREPVDRCVLMIQPTLYSYDLDTASAQAVPLDSQSLRDDNIVLMDAFFNIHIMWGTGIYEWIKARYHENPEYEYFTELLSAAENDAQLLLALRFPYPRFSRTDANGSEARHIKTRVNPAHTYNSQGGGADVFNPYAAGGAGRTEEQADVINTDDTSIAKFMSSLKRAVTTEAPKEKKMKEAIVESASTVTSFLKKE